MTRPLFDSEHIFGIHEPGGEQHMQDAGHPGWILFTEGIGSDPQNFSSADYQQYSSQGFGVISRLNNGYHPDGTIPHSSRYAEFAARCANFVANSRGCKIWIIGNEMNYEIERPSAFAPADMSMLPAEDGAFGEQADDVEISTIWGRWLNQLLLVVSGGMGDAELGTPPAPLAKDEVESDANGDSSVDDDPYHRSDPSRFSALHMDEVDDEPDGLERQSDPFLRSATEVITPALYASCYRQCRDAIHAVPGHENDQVLIGAVAPWNNQTAYDGNSNGDWVLYFQDILEQLGTNGCDGITLHTYTHQADPNLIHSDAKMNPPFENHHYEFRAYQDFMNAVPADMRHLPLYITETDEDVAWHDDNIGWVQRAYGEIDYWNRQSGNQQIRSLILYRWPNIDRWYIDGKNGVINDFRDALQYDYRWRPEIAPYDFEAGDLLQTTDYVNLRRTPGYVDKPADDLLATLPVNAQVRVVSSEYANADGLFWWRVDTVDDEADSMQGWLAQTSTAGVPLVQKVDTTVPEGEIGVGTTVRTLTIVRMRNTPGYAGKAADDVIADIPAGKEGPVTAGPEQADGLTWWRVQTTNSDGVSVEGWMAEVDPSGMELLEPIDADGDGGETGDNRFEIGDSVITLDYVRVRRTTGYAGKDESDVVMDVPPETVGQVLVGPETKDDLIWWHLTFSVDGGSIQGWAAETAPNGVELLGPYEEPATPPTLPPTLPPTDGSYRIGELVQAATYARVRRTPGYNNKPADDTLGAFNPEATLNIIAGPRQADELTWWQVGGISPNGEIVGWVAETAPNGVAIMQRPPKLAGTNIPDTASGSYLGAPFTRRFGASQIWGENPDVYGQFTYDGVPLQGHNGIDFLTPTGAELLAVDDGQVLEVVYYDMSGFGHYIKILHSWGESLYAHLADMLVIPGDTVRRGQLIGHTDNTGFSGGPHLHFSIRINPFERTDGWGGFSDPLPYMNPDDFELPSYVTTPSRMSGPAAPAAAPAPGGTTPRQSGPRFTGAGMAPDHPDVARP